MKALNHIQRLAGFALIILFEMGNHIEAGSPKPRDKTRPSQSSKNGESEYINREHPRPEPSRSEPSVNEIKYEDRSHKRNPQSSTNSYSDPVDEPESQDEKNREYQETEQNVESIGHTIGCCISHISRHRHETNTFNLIGELLTMGFGENLYDPIRFPSYPYFLNEPGFIRRGADDYRKGFGWFSVRYLGTMTGNHAMGLSFRGRTYSRCAISLDYHQTDKILSQYKKPLFNTFRFGIQKKILINELFIFDLDLGFRTVNKHSGGDIGFHVQAFPEKPFIFSGWGRIGIVNNNNIYEFDASVGILINRYELYLGVHTFHTQKIDQQSIQMGWRFWF